MGKIEVQNRYNRLQALRGWAFIGIFLRHAGGSFSWAELGVSIFFCMSGFLLVRKHYSTANPISFRENVSSVLQKVSKLYLLHIITMLCMVLMEVKKLFQGGSVKRLLIEVFFNVTLLQSWIPTTEINVSLNGVAWFLSTSVFLWFMFPYIMLLIKKYKNRRSCVVVSVLVIILQLIAATFFYIIKGAYASFYIWSTYCFPIFRLGDFIVGCNMGWLTLHNNYENRISKEKATLIETATLVFTGIILWWGAKKTGVMLIDAVIKNWTTIYILVAILWICLFYYSNGKIIELFTNKFFVFIGNISAYAFLIHYVITMSFMNMDMRWYMPKNVRIVLEFFLTILFSLYWKKIKGRRCV